MLPSLRERDWGPLTGLTMAEIEARFPAAIRPLRDDTAKADLPGVESLVACTARARAAWQEVISAEPAGRVVVISHGFLLRRMVHAMIFGLADDRVGPQLSLDSAAIHHVALRGGGCYVHALNDRRHLVE